MRKILALAVVAAALSGCSMDEESKAKLEQAASHAKEAAKQVGEVVSTKTAEVGEKWKDMNADRIEETPREDPNLPAQEKDVSDLTDRFKAAKDAFLKDPDKSDGESAAPRKEG